MKILIVNTSELTGGAAVAAHRLAKALINSGIKTRMLVRQKQTNALYVAQTGSWLSNQWNFVAERLTIFVHNLFSMENLFKVSIANTGLDITKTAEFQEADIIHLHWVNQGFLSLKTIRKILRSGKPVVWTMHDMWEATAICHHAYECRRYETECMECPFLRRPGRKDLSNSVFHKKQRVLEAAPNLTFVTVSQWLAERAKASALTGCFHVEVIPNVISLSHFKIIERLDARTALDVSEPYVIAFGAARIDDPIKGFGYLLEALRHLVQHHHFAAEKLRLLLFGNIRDASLLSKIPIPYTHLGYVNDDDRLSLVYSAANITVSSSLYETFGQTLIEAMACGSIPVSFDGSGQADIIQHLQTGFLARRLDAQSLAEGMAWGLNSDIDPQQLRRSVTRRYSESVVARRYQTLYEDILKKRTNSQP